MSFINSFNFFIFIFQFILQFYYIFIFITDITKFFIFNNKTVTNFFKQLNNLYKKHKIIEND